MVNSELIRNGHVVGWVGARRPVHQGLRYRIVGDKPDTFIFVGLIIGSRLKHNAESKIVKLDAMSFEMIPHRAGFVVIFRVNCPGRTVHCINAGSFRIFSEGSVSAITGRSGCFHPFVRVGVYKPAMSVGRVVGIDIEIV